jgi:Rrf2 family protein
MSNFVLAITEFVCLLPAVRISQKLEYACRALTQLAKRYDGRTITRLEEIAQREAVSANFLVQILNDLRRASLVMSRRGKTGGYMLARDANTINLAQIAEAVDPALVTNSVRNNGQSGAGVQEAWESVARDLHKKLQSITVEQMTQAQGGSMFHI